MAYKVGESGKVLRVAAGFDMSSYTELTLSFTKPDATTDSKTYSGGDVTIGAGVTDADLGVLAANEYVEFTPDATFHDQAGTWQVQLTYTNTAPTPDDVFIGDCVSYTVSAATC